MITVVSRILPSLTLIMMRSLRNSSLFHRGGYVHGDIRDTNIMVKKDFSPGFMLVDFDWSGTIGEARYPVNVYQGERLWRPDGAEDGQLVMPEHDMQMLYAIFPEGTFV
ncbi:uncharacterized protein HD556DRAFT_731545 [Suillus plorans]|uniref:Uncharacterized protein n=1 Tax=Suillus plorans TaxID=116603 RepID=A0A9P7DF88_9AGAM|nr:uncharacterized protein HD556DRAFT_731545 [Suillus plorans]KAG1790462.1 hypothetical protein HD556DRAFT_731545 [Suillus plorans]